MNGVSIQTNNNNGNMTTMKHTTECTGMHTTCEHCNEMNICISDFGAVSYCDKCDSKLKTVELFAGTKSFSKAAERAGMMTFTSDFDASFETDYTVDVMQYDTLRVPFDEVDILWASPPCETFSVASLGHHWTGGKGAYEPKTQACLDGIERVKKTLDIIKVLEPKIWIIENPRGVLRKMPFMNEQGIYRYTVTYCQYGDTRMKPTDLWSNSPDLVFKPACKNGQPCHIAAPRGSSTGTQGIKTYKDRSRIPNELCDSVVSQLSKLLQ